MFAKRSVGPLVERVWVGAQGAWKLLSKGRCGGGDDVAGEAWSKEEGFVQVVMRAHEQVA